MPVPHVARPSHARLCLPFFSATAAAAEANPREAAYARGSTFSAAVDEAWERALDRTANARAYLTANAMVLVNAIEGEEQAERSTNNCEDNVGNKKKKTTRILEDVHEIAR